MTVLGIETSCDDTSAAIVRDGNVVSNVISSQLVHGLYGGVVPELASRAHQRVIIQIVEQAQREAGVVREGLDAVAATYGPGLVGALLVGLNFGKSMAYGLGIPFVGVNHMEGHLYSNFLTEPRPSYPFLSMIVSGGHTMLVHVDEPQRHRILGQTRDDAAGEAFDKVAKMLGLGYPGGPIIDRLAVQGNNNAIRFPRAFLGEGNYDFSFSGVKTAVLYYLRDRGLLDSRQSLATREPRLVADICASFQAAVVGVLVDKTMEAARAFNVRDVTLSGGVSANSFLRRQMAESCALENRNLHHPPMEYCMDNGAMIAYVGWMKLQRGEKSPLQLSAVANLELT